MTEPTQESSASLDKHKPGLYLRLLYVFMWFQSSALYTSTYLQPLLCRWWVRLYVYSVVKPEKQIRCKHSLWKVENQFLPPTPPPPAHRTSSLPLPSERKGTIKIRIMMASYDCTSLCKILEIIKGSLNQRPLQGRGRFDGCFARSPVYPETVKNVGATEP